MSDAAALGHVFADATLLERALTHRSAAHANNERLEFLGDALLNLLVAELIYEIHPRASEGDMTRLRAALVNGGALAEMARTHKLGDRLHLGPGELKSGGHRRDSILADAFEAVIAAAEGGSIIPRISGMAHVSAFSTIICEADDPLAQGFLCR